MSARLAAVAALALALALLGTAEARADETYLLHSDRTEFYGDLLLLRGTGDVTLRLPNATVTGRSFVMEVRRDHILIAGNVLVTSGTASYAGVAFSEDLVDDRASLIALDGGPHVQTFENGDFSKPLEDRPAESDAFLFPSIASKGKERATVVGREVTIGPRRFLRFGPCRLDIGASFGAYLPLPSFYISFSGTSPDLAQSGLSPANARGGFPLAGNANSSTKLVLQNNPQSGFQYGVQENLSSTAAWAATSVVASTSGSNYYDVVAASQPSNAFMTEFSGEYHTSRTAIASQPTYGWLNVQATAPLGTSFAQVNATYEDLTSLLTPHRPSNLELALVSPDLPGKNAPVSVRLRYAMGLEGDPYGLQTLNGTTYTTLSYEAGAVSLSVPEIKLVPDGSTYFSLLGNVSRQTFSTAHHVDHASGVISLTHRYAKGAVYASYDVENVADDYGAEQRLAYPVVAVPQAPGYAAFAGFATLHTLSAGVVYAPEPNFSVDLVGRQRRDFPAAVPNFFPNPTSLYVLGQSAPVVYFGRYPYEVALATRFRVRDQLAFDIQDSYVFNFGGHHLVGFQLQFLP